MSKSAAKDLEYTELVLPKWTSFLPLLIVYPTFWLTLAPFDAGLGSILGILVTALISLAMVTSSPRITISASKIRVGRAEIELSLLGKATVIEKTAQFAARGSQLDARAYLSLQPSVQGLIRLELNDPADPTPYWLFSSRKPEIVAGLLAKQTTKKK